MKPIPVYCNFYIVANVSNPFVVCSARIRFQKASTHGTEQIRIQFHAVAKFKKCGIKLLNQQQLIA